MRAMASIGVCVVALLVTAAGCATTAYHEGNSRLARGDNPGAIAQFTEAIQQDPQNFCAYLNRGVAYQRMKQYDQALRDYDEAIRIVPAFGMAYHYRGHIHSDRNEYELAIRDYDQAIKCAGAVQVDGQGQLVAVDLPAAYYDRGNALYRLGRYQEAVESYDQALALAPNFTDATNNRRIASSKLGGG